MVERFDKVAIIAPPDYQYPHYNVIAFSSQDFESEQFSITGWPWLCDHPILIQYSTL
jgi:hypothetical protein